jgi:hypothetical protein
MAEAKEDEEKEDRLGRSDETFGSKEAREIFRLLRHHRASHSNDRGQNQSTGRRRNSLPNHPAERIILFVERLAGYGDAQRWALDLKTDLEAFKVDKEVAGPISAHGCCSPGHQEPARQHLPRRSATPFSVPLIATSVARWLEASHLGDVLAAMNATFEQATRSRSLHSVHR